MDAKKILLVEDSRKDVDLTLSALEEHNLANEVVVTRNGVEALDYLFLECASLGLVGSEIAQDHERASGIEPGIRGLRAQQPSHEQTRGNQEQHGNGDLPAYQKTTQA